MGRAMLRKLRKALNEVKGQKFQYFSDFERILNQIRRHYGSLFPKFKETRNGSIYVYHFGVSGVYPISIHKEHGSRECIPRRFAKYIIQGIEDVLTFIEENTAGEQEEESESEKETTNEPTIVAEETFGALPKPKLPDGDC
jgi:hypothetical protein